MVVHDLDQALAAFAAAAELEVPVTVTSAPGAALYQGVGYVAALVAAARKEFPAVTMTAILDCGDAPGLALAAFRHGFTAVRVAASAKARAKVADIARHYGATLVTGRLARLDLAQECDPRAACRAWLAQAKRPKAARPKAARQRKG